MERLARFNLQVDYCRPCRSKHADLTKRRKVPDLPKCEETDGKHCNYIQNEPPYQLHPDNWLPLFLYEKIIQFSPYRTLHLGSHSNINRAFSIEAMQMVMNTYATNISEEEHAYVIEALGIIVETFASHEAGKLSDSATRKK